VERAYDPVSNPPEKVQVPFLRGAFFQESNELPVEIGRAFAVFADEALQAALIFLQVKELGNQILTRERGYQAFLAIDAGRRARGARPPPWEGNTAIGPS